MMSFCDFPSHFIDISLMIRRRPLGIPTTSEKTDSLSLKIPPNLSEIRPIFPFYELITDIQDEFLIAHYQRETRVVKTSFGDQFKRLRH